LGEKEVLGYDSSSKANARSRFRKLLSNVEMAPGLALLVMCIVLSLTSPVFLTLFNLVTVARQFSLLAIVAVGQTIAIISGEFDLSVGSVAGFCGLVFAIFVKEFGIPWWIAIAGGMGVGALFGLVNAFVITRLKVSSFIATLGMMSIARSLTVAMTMGTPIIGFPKAFLNIGSGYIGRIPIPVILMLIIIAVGYLFLRFTVLGRYIYATGGNVDAALISGVPTRRVKTFTLTVSGALAGLAGIVLVARLASAEPMAGQGWELESVAAVVIGGTSLFGGRGSMFGSFLGVALMGILRNGLVLLGVRGEFVGVATGLVLILAVGVDQVRRRMAETIPLVENVKENSKQAKKAGDSKCQ